jgi:predicted RNA methylase
MTASAYNPRLYDLVTAASQGGDVEWYSQQARQQGSPILELGAGTGRIVLPIAQAGYQIHALEYDAGMREALIRRIEELPEGVRTRIQVIAGDMRCFTLETRYALIQIPYRAFLHNLTRADQLACLACCREHLQAEGLLAFNVFHPSLEYMSRHHSLLRGVWRWNAEIDHPDGGVLVYSEANRYDPALQRVSSRHRYEHFDAQGQLVEVFYQRLELAYLYPGDIRDLLGASGYSQVTLYGGFDRRPFSADGQELVVLARP